MSKFYGSIRASLQRASSTTPTPDQLAQINALTLVPVDAEAIYVRDILVSTSAFMRSGRRVREDALQRLAETLPGKSFFAEGHPGGGIFGDGYIGPGVGRFFAARIMTMTPEEFTAMTGERADLPPGIATMTCLYGSLYIPRAMSMPMDEMDENGKRKKKMVPMNSELIANIDAGIYTHVSMGWDSQTAQMKDEATGREWMECIPPAEAMEVSLVWLGDVRGAKVATLERMLSEAREQAAAPPDSTGTAPERPEGGAKILRARFVK